MVRDLPNHREAGSSALSSLGSAVLSRHAWGPRAAYASQFLDPVGRAWRKKAKIKARLIGDEDLDEWDLPPKPKRMRLRTYERWEARFDQAEDALDEHLCRVAARLLNR